jgi:hypothetical protein
VFFKRRAVRGELSVIVMDRRPFATLVLALAASALAGATASQVAGGPNIVAGRPNTPTLTPTFRADGTMGDQHCQKLGITPTDDWYQRCRGSDQGILDRQPLPAQCHTNPAVQSKCLSDLRVRLDQALLKFVETLEQSAEDPAQMNRTRLLHLQLKMDLAQAQAGQ